MIQPMNTVGDGQKDNSNQKVIFVVRTKISIGTEGIPSLEHYRYRCPRQTQPLLNSVLVSPAHLPLCVFPTHASSGSTDASSSPFGDATLLLEKSPNGSKVPPVRSFRREM